MLGTYTPLYHRLAAAFVRGRLGPTLADHHPTLFRPPLDLLNDDELMELVELGYAHELRLHRFKRTMGLARVGVVIGVLRGLAPSNLLDLGSGRGAFLWPVIDALPWLPITAVDTLDYRVADLQAIAAGGFSNLHAYQADATNLPFATHQFEVVTMLEVLEHIPDTHAAIAELMRVARRFVVLSVPSHPDDNPEHIHLFHAEMLEQLLRQYGAARVNIRYVPGHMIAVARKGR